LERWNGVPNVALMDNTEGVALRKSTAAAVLLQGSSRELTE
jgi:hypothetical protein